MPELRSDGDGMESQPREVRRPKFVPHEPYKAAVTCERTRLTALEIPFPLYQVPSCEPPLLAVVREVPEGATPPSSSGDPLEQRLHEMHQCNQDLQEQLRVQVEVNRELKKLLVASVGEDLEARVHFLSEDKAQLAADVRAYAQRLSQGREEIDRLAIHADVWRSKFLAASLLVDELATCKARLVRQCDDFQEALQWIASEHQQLEANLTATCRLLAQLQQGEVPREPCDMLELSAQAQRAARSLCHQMAAPRGGNLRLGPSPAVCATSAETFARRTDCAYETLKRSFTSSAHSALKSSIASSSETAAHGSIIACCRHCSGHLETI